MPRVTLNRKKYMISDIGSWVKGKLHRCKRTQRDLANELDITQQGLSFKIKENIFSYGDLLTIFDFVGATDEEILYVMKLKRG